MTHPLLTNSNVSCHEFAVWFLSDWTIVLASSSAQPKFQELNDNDSEESGSESAIPPKRAIETQLPKLPAPVGTSLPRGTTSGSASQGNASHISQIILTKFPKRRRNYQ
jgi:hypothetical protein